MNKNLQAEKDKKLIKELFVWNVNTGIAGFNECISFLGSYFPGGYYEEKTGDCRFYSEIDAEYGIFFRDFGKNESF